MKNLLNSLILILGIVICFCYAKAEEDVKDFSESDLTTLDVKQYKKFNVKFDDELVKGGKESPDTEFIFQKSDFNFKKLIRLRENFIPEVQKGKDDMRGLK